MVIDMPRNMSVAMTTPQVRIQIKDMTRRFGWWFLKPGDVINLVEKSMGLQKGEKIVRICQVRVKSTRPEPLNAITQADVIREGFPHWTPEQFIQMLVDHYKIDPSKICNVIEFEYIQTPQTIITKCHLEGQSVITMMVEVNALCGLSVSENEIVHNIASMGLSLPQRSKDLETPVP